jgi:polyphenol oxidase
MCAIKTADLSPFLYQTPLGNHASVSVTHTLNCKQDTFAGNLGLHVQDDPVAVQHRRERLAAAIGKPIVWLNQVHGVTVHTANQIEPTPTADAAVTADSAFALAVMTADCLPVALCARNAAGQTAIGIAHAGWRGLLNGVLEQTVLALNALVPHAQLDAHLGPCIGVAQFEVGREVRAAFVDKTADSNMYFTALTAHTYLCDLEALARATLYSAGVGSVSGGGWCTVSDPRLTSYRRQSVTGRFATVVRLN